MKKIIISESQVSQVAEKLALDYPKYSKTLINLANRWSKATATKQFGLSVSDLFLKFGGNTKEQWEQFLYKSLPEEDSVSKAKDKIKILLNRFKDALDKIDDDVIYHWLEDLLVDKSFKGLTIQQKVLARLAKERNCEYRTATAEEEAKNIDGYVCNNPISVKNISYKKQIEPLELENIKIPIVYYYIDKSGELILKHDLKF